MIVWKGWQVIIASTILVFALVACSGNVTVVETETPVRAAGRAIVLGDISDDPAEVIDGTQPLADYLTEHLKEFGITSGQVRIVSSASEMAQLMKDGKVDLYFDSTYPATLISDEIGAQIILRRWRFGVEEYHSVIFASQESGITTLDDLKGHVVAMDAPYSTSGYVLPAVYMIENGLKLARKE